jgi:hypothetical protein
MHAAVNAMPMPESAPSLGGKWIKANLLIAITFPLTAGLLPFVLDRMIPETVSNHTIGWINAALLFFVVAVNMAAYAILTGSVLSEKLPAFSRRAWIAAHLAFAAVFALIAKATFSPAPATGGARWTTPDGQFDVLGFLILALVLLPVIGAILGGLQALVLRRAARGTLAWIAGFAISVSAIGVLREVVVNLVRFNSEPVTSLVTNGVTFAMVMVMAIVMLPAFNRLAPKN